MRQAERDRSRERDREHDRPVQRRTNANRLIASLNYAFHGILYAAKSQPNMRIHLFAALFVLVATLFLHLQRVYVVIVVLLVGLVLALELMNTAVEAIVDLMTLSHHPLAKVAKDAAAGAVLTVSITAVVVGYLVFYEAIQHGGSAVYDQLRSVSLSVVFVSMLLTIGATILLKAYVGRGTPLQGGAVSGHAAIAFVAACFIFVLSSSPLVGTLGFVLALLVAQSRVEGGIHTVLEVLYGTALGAVIALAIFLMLRIGHVLQ
ncbi:MAG: diacylglycerol kinase [bacterium]|nr:diacylglycerol kinase [bacterium]